ncbi:MAG: DotG/IcmE/VirB10 family protein [Gammaproteobacteria bacterium]|nr:DotG/IcmE/VirB10 family protein [Gammaproteobacteria bacterium]
MNSNDRLIDGTSEIGVESSPQIQRAQKIDPGAKRNLLIIGGVVGGAVLIMAAMALMSNNSGERAQKGDTPTSIAGGMSEKTRTDELTPYELDKLNRVTEQRAQEAAKKGETFIPPEVPLIKDSSPPPSSLEPVRYDTDRSSRWGQGYDEERMQRVMQGFQAQLGRLAQMNMAPSTSSAERYPVAERQANLPSETTTPKAPPVNEGVVLVEGLHLAAAELLSPVETEKTSFASAKIVSGPLAGGTLYGTAQMVADQGVHIRFNRLLLNGASYTGSYTVNAVALDPAVSHDTLSADVDRKIFERYVLPVFGAAASAYLRAKAQPAQTLVLGTSATGVSQVIQPEYQTKQAAAQGLASGVEQLLSEYSSARAKPSATIPAGAPIGVLFLDPVKCCASDRSQTARLSASNPSGATLGQ